MTSSVIGALRVSLGLNSAAFTSGLTAAQQSLRQTARSIDKVGKQMAGIGATMSLALTAPLVALGAKMGAAAIEAEEMQSAFAISFGAMAADTEKWAKTTSDAMGRSTFELQQMALGFNGLFKAGGPVSAQATEMAKTFTTLAQDLASFHNISEQDAFAALRSGLSGEAEPLRKFNVYLTEGGLKAEAYALGIAKAGAKLTEQQKIQARASLILKATSEAQGDVIRTADGTQGRLRTLQSTFAELSVELGAKLLPIFSKVVGALTNMLTAFSGLSPQAQNFLLVSLAITAALGPLIGTIGGVLTGTAAMIKAYNDVTRALIAATGATSVLNAAMIVLRNTVAFIMGPWGIALMAIAAAIAIVMHQIKQASAEERQAIEGLDKATDAYADAAQAAAVATGKDAKAKRDAAAAARAEAIENRNGALEKLNSARASLALARAQAASMRSNPILYGIGLIRQKIMEDRTADLEAAVASTEKSIDSSDRIINARAPGGNAPAAPDADGKSGGRGGQSAEDLAREAEQRRRALEDYNHEIELQEAQLKGDLDRVAALERQASVRERSRTLVDAEIIKDRAAAEAEAERVEVRLDAAREEAELRDDAIARREWEARLWDIDGRQDRVQMAERQSLLEERTAFWQSKQRDHVTALSIATSELAEWDLARAEAAERATKASALDLEIEKARLRGDTRAENRLTRQARVNDLTERYQTDDLNPLSPTDARARAEAEIQALDDAALQGKYRDFVKSGFQAAMDGDLAGFAQNWIKDWAGKGLEESLNSLADVLMSLFKNIDWGKGPAGIGGGGINLGGIGKAIGGLFGKIPGFSTGGSFKVGGSGSVDSKLVSMRLTPGEMVDVRRPGQLQAANNNTPVSFDLRGAVMTPDLLAQMEGMASQSGGNALRTARTAVPADRAKSDKYKLGGRR